MRTVVVEDEMLFRELLCKVCVTELGCPVVGKTGSKKEAEAIIEHSRPDLVLLDLRLPDGDGFEVAEFIHGRWPYIQVLMISAYCDPYTIYRVERSSARGFIDKNTQAVGTMIEAIEALRRGETYFPRPFQIARQARIRDSHSFDKVLSEREREVLTLIGYAHSDEEIAERLGISTSTAQTHRSRIICKLGLTNSLRLVQFAIQQGFSRINEIRESSSIGDLQLRH